MTLRIGFAYNQKPTDEETPGDDEPPPSAGDRYAEWDDPATIDAVAAALSRFGDVVRLEAVADFPARLLDSRPDIVFNIAEGAEGPNREAHVPAICEFFGIPYTGSDPLTLSLALEKRRAKEIFRARRVPTPTYVVADPSNGGLPRRFPLPAVVKPLFEGSSKGIPDRAYCETGEAVRERVQEVFETYCQPALVERFLPGREFTCAILGNGAATRVLPIVEVRLAALPAGAAPIYGYEAKWIWDSPEAPLEVFDCPADVPPELARALERTALAAHHALGCRDWSRVDLRLDESGRPHVLEVNPLPGILPDPRQNSCYPKAARAAGLDFDAMIGCVLAAALERYGMRP